MKISVRCGAGVCAMLLVLACRLSRQSKDAHGPNAAGYL